MLFQLLIAFFAVVFCIFLTIEIMDKMGPSFVAKVGLFLFLLIMYFSFVSSWVTMAANAGVL